jgi:hypothetical protein
MTPGANGEQIRKLYDEIAKEQQKLGKLPNLTVEQLAAMVQKQTDTIREKYHVTTVAFRVETVDGKVKLKAKSIGTINDNHLSNDGTYTVMLTHEGRGETINITAHVSGIDGRRTDLVSVSEVAKLRPDLNVTSLSVPPRPASIRPSRSAAARTFARSAATSPFVSCTTWLPKREKANRSAGASPARIPCSARRAASMLSPVIDPEQSTSSFTLSGKDLAWRGRSAQKLASATKRSPSCATTASERRWRSRRSHGSC